MALALIGTLRDSVVGPRKAYAKDALFYEPCPFPRSLATAEGKPHPVVKSALLKKFTRMADCPPPCMAVMSTSVLTN